MRWQRYIYFAEASKPPELPFLSGIVLMSSDKSSHYGLILQISLSLKSAEHPSKLLSSTTPLVQFWNHKFSKLYKNKKKDTPILEASGEKKDTRTGPVDFLVRALN